MIPIEQIQEFIGPATEKDLRHVDCYLSEPLGIFIPSVGFCDVATQVNHKHPTYSFTLLLSDKTIFKTDLKKNANHYVGAFLSPDIPHAESKGSEFTRYIALFIKKEFFESIYLEYDKQIPFFKTWHSFLVPKEIMLFLTQFMNEYENNRTPALLNSLSLLIVHYLIRYYLGHREENKVTIEDYAILDILDYLAQHYAEKITIHKLASLTGLSESTFLRQFKKETGTSPINYLIHLRLKKAQKLLRSKDYNVTEVAMKCGFISTAHLSAAFKKAFKIPPLKYRQLHKKSSDSNL